MIGLKISGIEQTYYRFRAQLKVFAAHSPNYGRMRTPASRCHINLVRYTNTRMTLSPISGCGWFKESTGAVSIPPPFSVKVEGRTKKAIDGVVVEPHKYAGWRVHCESWDSHGNYTVVLDSPDGSGRVTGFADSDA